MFKVTANVPTRYQYNSIAFFGSPVAVGDGSYKIEEEFETYREAVDYLNYRIDIYASENGTEEEIESMREEAAKGSLTYDACRAFIEEVNTILVDGDNVWDGEKWVSRYNGDLSAYAMTFDDARALKKEREFSTAEIIKLWSSGRPMY